MAQYVLTKDIKRHINVCMIKSTCFFWPVLRFLLKIESGFKLGLFKNGLFCTHIYDIFKLLGLTIKFFFLVSVNDELCSHISQRKVLNWIHATFPPPYHIYITFVSWFNEKTDQSYSCVDCSKAQLPCNRALALTKNYLANALYDNSSTYVHTHGNSQVV